MRYHSTRDSKKTYSASEAILQGLAPDGGLFVPESIPDWRGKLKELSELSYPQLCLEVILAYFEEFKNDERFSADIASAFDKFSNPTVVELKTAGNVFMELFHGPTCAFKDFALSVLPHEIAAAKRIAGETRSTAVLTATSGDTGKAALEAFRGLDGFKIAVVYPKDGVSAIQALQMNATQEDNTLVCGLEGNFDDCQRLIKEMLSQRYEEVCVTSANSINIARLVPQITYYFYTYFMMQKQGMIKAGELLDFCVPTGNFGNILSGYLAKCMGLPVGKLICASNANNVLADFFETGIYDKKRKFFITQSPSMDILVSSNFERFMWFVTRDDAFVSGCMRQLNAEGMFDAKAALSQITDFTGGFADEEQTSAEILRMYNEYNYLIDPHTAVASYVANKAVPDGKTVIASTADPYKFCTSVLNSLGAEYDEQDGELARLDLLQTFTKTAAPFPLASLKHCLVKHNNSGGEKEIQQKIKQFLESK